MTTVELLQQVGLNKYEAEAYYTLLAEGPLTGYELGKRSQVPLSRSYEILERLVQRGLALMQPGDPPHYVAEEARLFLERVRESMSETLDALGGALMDLPRQDVAGEFWVLRSRQPILDRARALIESAQREIAVRLPPEFASYLAATLARAGARGCQVYQPQTVSQAPSGAPLILLLIDGQMALAGLLAPAERCQAVVSANPALIAALQGYFTRQEPAALPVSALQAVPAQPRDDRAWVAWEDRKQHHLWRLNTGGRVA